MFIRTIWQKIAPPCPAEQAVAGKYEVTVAERMGSHNGILEALRRAGATQMGSLSFRRSSTLA